MSKESEELTTLKAALAASTPPDVGRRRIPVPTAEERAARSLHLSMQQALTTSYLQSRALVEMLTLLNNNKNGFPDFEQVQIQQAYGYAHSALLALDGAVEDTGNKTGRIAATAEVHRSMCRLAKIIENRVDNAMARSRDQVFLFRFNDWFHSPEVAAYIRGTHRMLAGREYKTIDFSNCTVKPDYEGQGYYGALLDQLQLIADDNSLALYAENVMNDKLVGFYEKRGYTKMPGYDGYDKQPCYYRLPK